MTRLKELKNKIDGIDEVKKPFAIALLQDFVKWEEIETDLLATSLFKVETFKGQKIAKELPSFKMLNTATARKEDALKSIVKLLDGDVGENSPLLTALNNFNQNFNSQPRKPYKVEIR